MILWVEATKSCKSDFLFSYWIGDYSLSVACVQTVHFWAVFCQACKTWKDVEITLPLRGECWTWHCFCLITSPISLPLYALFLQGRERGKEDMQKCMVHNANAFIHTVCVYKTQKPLQTFKGFQCLPTGLPVVWKMVGANEALNDWGHLITLMYWFSDSLPTCCNN